MNAVSDYLAVHSFEAMDPYDTDDGAMVYDFFRNQDRVTVLFAPDDVPLVMTYVDKQFGFNSGDYDEDDIITVMKGILKK